MSTRFRRHLPAATIIALAIAASAPAQVLPRLTGLQAGATLAPERLDAGVLRRQRLTIDAALLQQLRTPGDRMAVELFTDTAVVAVLDRVTDDRFNGYVWNGHIAGDPFGAVILVLEDGDVTGEIRTQGRRFALRPAGPGRGLALETDLRVEGFGDDAVVPPARLPVDSAAIRPAGAAKSVIDILGLYYPLVQTEAGSAKQVKADFRAAIAAFNMALMNANIDMTVRLMSVKKVTYGKTATDSESTTIILQDLTNATDGQMDKAHSLRNKFGADFVSLAIDDNQAICGKGWLNGNGDGVPPTDNAWAFNVITWKCLALLTTLTTAHETGHNMGMNHDRDNSRESIFFGAYDFSYGFRVPGHFRTIMAYSCQSFGGLPECPRVTYFSNPKVNYEGVATGVKDSKPDGADAATSLNLDRAVFEGFTACKKKC